MHSSILRYLEVLIEVGMGDIIQQLLQGRHEVVPIWDSGMNRSLQFASLYTILGA